jgi:hypothetical protein
MKIKLIKNINDLENFTRNLFQLYVEQINQNRDESRRITKVIPTGRYDDYDVYFENASGERFIVEIKYRPNKSNTHYDYSGGWMLEVEKYNKLMQHSKELNAKAIYMNFFDDNSILLYDLNNINFNNRRTYIDNCPAQTIEQNKPMFVKKQTYHLHSSEAIQSKFEDATIYKCNNINYGIY